MAIAVSYGGDDEFNALCYGVQKHPGTLAYLHNQVTSITNTLTNAGAQFFSDAHQIYDRFNGSEAMRLARAAVRKAGGIFQRDGIRPLFEIGDIQNAPLTMQRFIMAEPTVRERFQQQKCAGYDETYVDMHPGTIGKNHYDYRRVMQGMIMVDEDGGEKYTLYLDDLHEGDRELALDEKVAVLNTWETVADLMRFGERDPTSSWDNKL